MDVDRVGVGRRPNNSMQWTALRAAASSRGRDVASDQVGTSGGSATDLLEKRNFAGAESGVERDEAEGVELRLRDEHAVVRVVVVAGEGAGALGVPGGDRQLGVGSSLS